jgi:hypothetical protein
MNQRANTQVILLSFGEDFKQRGPQPLKLSSMISATPLAQGISNNV